MTIVPWTTKPRTGLVVWGSIVLGLPYLCSAVPGVIGSVIGGGDTAWPLAIPVLGPFIQIIHDALGPHDSAIFGNPLTGGIMLGFVGLAEAAGLTMVLVGALDRRRVPDFSQHALRLAPLIAPGSSGLAILGRF